MQSDPIGLAAGVNTFGYVGGSPTRYSDPLGLNPAAGAIGGGMVAGPPGAVVGGIIGIGIGIVVGDAVVDQMRKDGDDSSGSGEGDKNDGGNGERDKVPPDRDGPPNGHVEGPNRDRDYGPDGEPIRDYDKPHQGADYPHIHEWPDGVREHPGRPYSPIPKKDEGAGSCSK